MTGDGPFVRGLRETDAPHRRQILMIDEFNMHLGNGTLASLVSDFQTPERQHRQHSEAAYLQWESRSRQPNNDWADWFGSEPVA